MTPAPHVAILDRVYEIYDEPGKTRIGYGFLLDPDCQFLVTAAHVIDSFKLPGENAYSGVRVKRRFPLGGVQIAEVKFVPSQFEIQHGEVMYCEHDFAILKLDTPTKRKLESALAGRDLNLSGVIKLLDNRTGTIDTQLSSIAACIHLKLASSRSDSFNPSNLNGMSGGPAWDDQTQQILGVFTSTHAADELKLEIVPLFQIYDALNLSTEAGAAGVKHLVPDMTLSATHALTSGPNEYFIRNVEDFVDTENVKTTKLRRANPFEGASVIVPSEILSDASEFAQSEIGKVSHLPARRVSKKSDIQAFTEVCESAQLRFSELMPDRQWKRIESDISEIHHQPETPWSGKQKWWYFLSYPTAHPLNSHSDEYDFFFETAATKLRVKLPSVFGSSVASNKTRILWEISLHWNSDGVANFIKERNPDLRQTDKLVSDAASRLMKTLEKFIESNNLGINIRESETEFSRFSFEGIQLQISFSDNSFSEKVKTRIAQAMSSLATCFEEFQKTYLENAAFG